MDSKVKNLGKLFIISGPSGAGKGTICKNLIANRGENNITLSISMTTRQMREGEVNGTHYYFASEKEFLERAENGGFLEYAKVYGNYYGTPKQEVENKLINGIDVILEIDIQGAMNVKKVYPNGIFIFILPPSMSILKKRLTERGTDSKDVINMRLSQTLNELSYLKEYDYIVINGDLKEAVNRVEAIVIAEHCKATEHIEEILKIYKEEE